MEIGDFSSLIEVGVTLNIAFVAVEYVKSYTKVLCNQVFKLQDFIITSFGECVKVLVDEETLAHIQPNKIGNGKNTNNLIERAKRTREIIKKEIDTEKDNFNRRIENVCEAKNVSSISLWLFFYGLVALFLCGCDIDILAKIIFWSILSVFAVAYSILGWSTNFNKGSIWLDFSSLRHAIIWFSLSVALSVAAASMFYEKLSAIIEACWNSVLFTSLVLMYSNFVASVVKVWNKARVVRKEIEKSSKIIQGKCCDLQRDVDKLINVNELCSQLEVESPELE